MLRSGARRWGLVVGALACLLAGAFWWLLRGDAELTRDEHYARILAAGVLRVGMDASFPPFEHQQGDALAGLDVDLAHELANRMGLRVEFVGTGFDALYEQLAAGHYDVVISALPYDRLRTRDVAYSSIYFRGGEVLVTRSGDREVSSLASLRARPLGVELGSNADTLARRLQRRNGYRLESFPSLDAAADALEAQSLDAVLADAVSARLLRRARPSLSLVGERVGDEPNYVIAMPLTATKLLAALNMHLRAMERDGGLAALIARWL